jgi:hypothetical protein
MRVLIFAGNPDAAGNEKKIRDPGSLKKALYLDQEC